MTAPEIALLKERRLRRQLRKELDRDLRNMQNALRILRLAMLTGIASELWLNSAFCQMLSGLEVIAAKQSVLDAQQARLNQLCKEVAELAVTQGFVPVGLLVTARGKDGQLDWASFQA